MAQTRRPVVPGVPGYPLPDPREEVARLRRELAEERHAADRLAERNAEHVREKSERPPPVEPQQVVIQGTGNGWRVSLPTVAITAILAALGARALPTPTQADSTLNEMRTAMVARDLQEERFRSEIRTSVEAMRVQLNASDTDMKNRLTIVDAKLLALQDKLIVSTVTPR